MSAVLGQEFLAAINSVIIDRHEVTLKPIRPGT